MSYKKQTQIIGDFKVVISWWEENIAMYVFDVDCPNHRDSVSKYSTNVYMMWNKLKLCISSIHVGVNTSNNNSLSWRNKRGTSTWSICITCGGWEYVNMCIGSQLRKHYVTIAKSHQNIIFKSIFNAPDQINLKKWCL